MKVKHRKVKRKLFNPDEIATAISQALSRDFMDAQHAYCVNDSTVAYAFNRQVNDILKKYCSLTSDKDRLQAEAFDKFRQTNLHMGQTNDLIRQGSFQELTRIQSSTKVEDKIHLRAKHLVNQVLGSFSLEEMYTEARNSSGSSLGVSYRDTSPEAKFTLPMSVTTRAKPYIVDYLTYDGSLRRAIDNFNDKRPLAEWYETVEGSRATTVDKTTEKRRFICIEPTANMFFQQGLMQMMYKRLKTVGLNVMSLPDRHKQWAKFSSISLKDATIDWSSASDCVSIELLRWLLPPAWFDMVWDLRCDSTELENGSREKLQMISTMGNAVTFPLETLTFWAYAMATIFTINNKTSNTMFPRWDHLYGCCSVFGDDCILPTYAAKLYLSVMGGIGFIVNDDKSFYDGPMQFRESCGGDYLAGYDVRPFTLKAPSSTSRSALEPWLYIITNALVEKYISYFGELSYVYDKALWRTIFGLFRKYKINIKLVPSYFPDDSGLKSITSDIQRFRSHYPMKLGRIDRSNHGTYTFRYCRYVYRTRKERNDPIRYCIWLKTPVATPAWDNVHEKYPIRRKGGYVVAKGLSAHWAVPGG